jgi:hypothetical protein
MRQAIASQLQRVWLHMIEFLVVVMDFLKQRTSLKKPFPKHYFISLFKDLPNKDLVALCGLLATQIGKPKRKLYATLRRRAWVP